MLNPFFPLRMLSHSITFVSWEERVISSEKGKRLVHYFLKNAQEQEILAVIGTEKSIRHMLYVIADDFQQVYGSYNFVDPNTKWRARRDAVQWLISMVTCNLSLTATAMGSQEHSSFDVSELQLLMPNSMIHVTRRLKNQGSEIVWSGAASICGKGLRHYPAFRRNETIIAVHSFVFVMAEGGGHYVGYLEDLYADKRGKKKANVLWFQHSREVNGMIPDLTFDPREIFITPFVQAISVDCIEGFAIVLTPTHYEKCLAVVSLNVSTQIHMCCRQMIDNKIKPFSLCSLRGYACQPVLASVDWPHSIGAVVNNIEFEISNPEKQIMKREPSAKKLKIKFPNGGERSIDLVKPLAPNRASFKCGQRIEVLSQDSGMRGCWFRCKVLKASPKCLKIQYVDVLDVEDSTNLEECISACRVANPDTLGMRCVGRPTIRPYPPKDSGEHSYEIGTAVDAWWCDAWWEGIVVGLGQPRTDVVQVFSPGEKLTLALEIKDLRISRDWDGDKWVEIMAKKDILTCISSSAQPDTVSMKLEAVDENVPVADLLKPLQIGEGKEGYIDKKEDVGGDGGVGKGSYIGLD